MRLQANIPLLLQAPLSGSSSRARTACSRLNNHDSSASLVVRPPAGEPFAAMSTRRGPCSPLPTSTPASLRNAATATRSTTSRHGRGPGNKRTHDSCRRHPSYAPQLERGRPPGLPPNNHNPSDSLVVRSTTREPHPRGQRPELPVANSRVCFPSIHWHPIQSCSSRFPAVAVHKPHKPEKRGHRKETNSHKPYREPTETIS